MLHQELNMLMFNVKHSAVAVLIIVSSFLTPITPLLLVVGLCIFADTFVGIWKAKKLKRKITSRKLSQIISKMVLYQSAIVLFFCIEKYILSDSIGLISQINLLLTKIVATTLISIELKSINENYETISGVSIWSKFKLLLSRTKELSNDVKEIKKDLINESETNYEKPIE